MPPPVLAQPLRGTAPSPSGDRRGRRQWLAGVARCSGAAMLGAALGGCHPQDPPVRVAAHPWPGYELFYLARHRGDVDARDVVLVETASATSSLRLLASGAVDAAALTLDEVLTVRDLGVPLTVVAVLDRSEGADVLLARPSVPSLAGLRGRSVGVEKTAVGAVMLQAALARAGLSPGDIRLHHLTIDEQEGAYRAGTVDALVTYEPVKTRVQQAGARVLYSSADLPGRIVDVLAVRSEVLAENPDPFEVLVEGHFRARQAWIAAPGLQAPLLAARLGLPAADVPRAFDGLALPDRSENRRLLAGDPSPLALAARELGAVMVQAGLLRRAPPLDGLSSDRLLGSGP